MLQASTQLLISILSAPESVKKTSIQLEFQTATSRTNAIMPRLAKAFHLQLSVTDEPGERHRAFRLTLVKIIMAVQFHALQLLRDFRKMTVDTY